MLRSPASSVPPFLGSFLAAGGGALAGSFLSSFFAWARASPGGAATIARAATRSPPTRARVSVSMGMSSPNGGYVRGAYLELYNRAGSGVLAVLGRGAVRWWGCDGRFHHPTTSLPIAAP